MTPDLSYEEFLNSKVAVARDRGADFPHEWLSPHLKPHQRDQVIWAIHGGNRAIFDAFGLGKTLIQIQITDIILRLHDGCALITCPLGVKQEFVRDGKKFFGIDFTYIRNKEEFESERARGQRFFLTNYERVRDGDIDPNRFQVWSLDEASVLRSFGSKTYQSFLEIGRDVPYKFVATATPSPNRYKELIHYAGFLGVMDTGQALTRFFKRDSSQAGNLQLHPHKEPEFWEWVSSWATFLQKPSDLGYSDEGYDLPPFKVITHRLQVDHSTAGYDSWGQGKLLRDAAINLRESAREKRDSMSSRMGTVKEIIDAGARDDHWIVWHDLEDERRMIEKTLAAPEYELHTVYGTQDLDEREEFVAGFTNGDYRIFASKPSVAGSGCNLQRFCHKAIFMGVGYKFNDFIQAIHRIYRFLQTGEVEIHIIYTESEDAVYETLMRKWKQHNELVARMSEIIRRYGLNNARLEVAQHRAIGLTREEFTGTRYTCVNNDNVAEMSRLSDSSVDLIVTSWPFSTQYEYSELYNDFGHNDGDRGFFEQMQYLTPEIMRVLKPGRMYCVHAKDRIVYGSVSGDGMYQVNPFSDKCVAHLRERGFRYCGRITVATDVVRENNRTYRLGWSEMCKDGTKMGVGSPEYVLLFRKLPTDTTNSYADEPVRHSKEEYTRARWQIDAHSFWRSSGDRLMTPEEIRQLPMDTLRSIWHRYNAKAIYDYDEHVRIMASLESKDSMVDEETGEIVEFRAGYLPASFMLLDPKSTSPWCWDDVARMKTLNTEQSRKRLEMHVCPLQIDIIQRLIERYSEPGNLVMDPFGGIGSVAHVALKMRRHAYTIELNHSYYLDALSYCRAAEQEVMSPTLFDLFKGEEDLSEAVNG